MVVLIGSMVCFVNQDEVCYNVFLVMLGSIFDFGYQVLGQSVDQVFSCVGVVLVSCNVYCLMEIDVLVVFSVYVVKVVVDGCFVLCGVLVGGGKLYYWNLCGVFGVRVIMLLVSGEVSIIVQVVCLCVLIEIDVGNVQ